MSVSGEGSREGQGLVKVGGQGQGSRLGVKVGVKVVGTMSGVNVRVMIGVTRSGCQVLGSRLGGQGQGRGMGQGQGEGIKVWGIRVRWSVGFSLGRL